MRFQAPLTARFAKPARLAAILIAGVGLWALALGVRGPQSPLPAVSGTAQAQTPVNPDNPCNPNAAPGAKADNPCNPDAAKADNPCNPDAAKADNPCNPDAAKASNPCNPCNPGAAQANNPCNPCNPDAAKANNPCNPCNPGAAQANNPCNPCNPGAASSSNLQGNGGKLSWGRDFNTWESVTGFVISNSHGNRLVRTYVDPPEAARVYRHNAELLRLRKTQGYKPFPPGTRIAQESWLRNDVGGPGAPGPMFFMRKEAPGFDAGGGDWEYGFTGSDLSLIAEGHDGKLGFCKDCHARVDGRDFVFAVER